MKRYIINPNTFEAFDGGHCYIRAHKDFMNLVAFNRFPARVDVEELEKLAEWAKVPYESKLAVRNA
jgi:hypothetical protein